ncbi:hypothetical protein [Neptuniibacter sp.]|uniref:hypothetical protein n=1 Tax=Neptuniibacter sp. TaxID=1962643 RepID=UPI002620BE8F|nr:hypothetical protein [Neptuniibacter sp.]MCP4598280.1 hypothetical protein [Neptuniibacter sp.]
MKKTSIILTVLLSQPLFAGDKRLNLECEAAPVDSLKYNEEAWGSAPGLTPQFARFVNTDSFSTERNESCITDDQGKDCAAINNLVWCEKPKSSFVLKSIRDDNSLFIVANRCDQGFKKYVKVNERSSDKELVLMEDKMFYQIEHQHIRGTALIRQPILILNTTLGSEYPLVIQSFTAEKWVRELPGSNIKSLKDGLGSAPIPQDKAISFSTKCSKKRL